MHQAINANLHHLPFGPLIFCFFLVMVVFPLENHITSKNVVGGGYAGGVEKEGPAPLLVNLNSEYDGSRLSFFFTGYGFCLGYFII